MSENSISFWNYLKGEKKRIVIPIIQRDYAQGREGKESLRKTFLKSISDALNKLDSKNPLKLDFIYGTRDEFIYDKKGKQKKGETIYPLDGQQRLTTLWLLHWYIALHAGKLSEAYPVLINFTYETRLSSREFFENLCNPVNFELFRLGEKVKDYIECQTWFYKEWLNDPSIKAAMRMIEGYYADTSKIDKKEKSEIERKNSNIDGLQKIFKNKEKIDFENYWRALTSDKAPIIFYQLPLDKFGLTDDLYIKMNARGEELTFFDNFKADLVGYMYQKYNEETYAEKKYEWEKLLDVRLGIPIKIDTDWADIFWKNKKKVLNKTDCNIIDDYRIDEIYYAFFNRIFWCHLILAKGKDGEFIMKDETKSIVFSHLNERDGDNSYPVPLYESLDQYKFFPVLVKNNNYEKEEMVIPIDVFLNLKLILDRYPQINKKGLELINGGWDDKLDFIPTYNTDTNSQPPISILTQTQRIIFFAVCKYLIEGEYQVTVGYDVDVKFKRWMRVVHNLISGVDADSNRQIRDFTATRTAISAIDKLKSHDVYQSLRSLSITGTSAFELRMLEEKDKATQILEPNSSELRMHTGSRRTWEDVIIEAERWGFFHGSIRFLFHNETNDIDWDNFDNKFKNTRQFFNKNATLTNSTCLNDEYREAGKEALLLKNFFSYFRINTSQTNAIWWRYKVFNNKAAAWLYYLLNPNLVEPIHKFLLQLTPTNVFKQNKGNTWYDKWENVLYLLSNTDLLDFMISDKLLKEAWLREYEGFWEFYKPYYPIEGIRITDYQRDEFLKNASGVICQTIPNTPLYHNTSVNFKFENKDFQWCYDNYIYLMEAQDTYMKKDIGALEKEEKFFCFPVMNQNRVLSHDEIINKMKLLISES